MVDKIDHVSVAQPVPQGHRYLQVGAYDLSNHIDRAFLPSVLSRLRVLGLFPWAQANQLARSSSVRCISDAQAVCESALKTLSAHPDRRPSRVVQLLTSSSHLCACATSTLLRVPTSKTAGPLFNAAITRY